MSTFNGRIKEYPTLSIDDFLNTGTSKHFILSHVHKGTQKKKTRKLRDLAH